MRIPLHYQYTEYDCGPTSVLNGVSYLFQREEIPPEIVQNIFVYSLDCCGEVGLHGRGGTSRSAMKNLSDWLGECGKCGNFPISCSYVSGEEVFLGETSEITKAIKNGSAAVLRLYLDPWHYVLMTGEDSENVYLFDPYFEDEEDVDEGIAVDNDHPFSFNRIAPVDFFNRETEEPYSLGNIAKREAVIISRTDGKNINK